MSAETKHSYAKNIATALMAFAFFYLKGIDVLKTDPIISIGSYIVYLELSKLLYTVLAGADTPILIRYVFAALAVGASIKVYEAMIHFEPDKIFWFSGVAGFFLVLRWLSLKMTKDGR